MSKNTIKFTKAAIENLPISVKGKRLEFYDTKTNHLLVRVSSTGRKTFQVYLERHAKTLKRSWKADQRNFEIHLAKTIGKKKLSTIS
jgi:hypothetical protein